MPQLEDFVECVAKVRRAAESGDGLGIRLFARAAGELVVGLLRPVNEPIVVVTRRHAFEAALTLQVAPPNYHADLPVCLGFERAVDAEVAAAAARLARETLAFIRERIPNLDPQPGVAEALAGGAFERHLGFASE